MCVRVYIYIYIFMYDHLICYSLKLYFWVPKILSQLFIYIGFWAGLGFQWKLQFTMQLGVLFSLCMYVIDLNVLFELTVSLISSFSSQAVGHEVGNSGGDYPLVVSTWPFLEAVRAAWTAADTGFSALDAVVEGCSTCEELRCDGTGGNGIPLTWILFMHQNDIVTNFITFLLPLHHKLNVKVTQHKLSRS